MNWVLAKASVIGKGHIENKLPCQDKHAVDFIDHNIGIAVVSDGAGSASSSDKGASLVCQKAIMLWRELLVPVGMNQMLSLSSEDLMPVFIGYFLSIKEYLRTQAEENEINYKDYAATCIVVLFSADGLICAHIGDGRAGFKTADKEWESMMVPWNGEFANQTAFITSDIWDDPQQFIEVQVISHQIESFTLMSDGAESSCYETLVPREEDEGFIDVNRPFPSFFDFNVTALRSLKEAGKKQEEIDEIWAKFIHNGNESFEDETDDKTLLLFTRVNVKSDEE